METVPSTVLTDPGHTVPAPDPEAPGAMAWLRAHVVRFADGARHQRLRELTDDVLRRCSPPPGRAEVDPASLASVLLDRAGLPTERAADVRLAAAAYQPHQPQDPAADAATDRLLAAAGGRTERAAARVCLVLQAHAGIGAALDQRTTPRPGPPVPDTRRVAPSGVEVLADLADAPFGRGPHRCPGELLTARLLGGVDAS